MNVCRTQCQTVSGLGSCSLPSQCTCSSTGQLSGCSLSCPSPPPPPGGSCNCCSLGGILNINGRCSCRNGRSCSAGCQNGNYNCFSPPTRPPTRPPTQQITSMCKSSLPSCHCRQHPCWILIDCYRLFLIHLPSPLPLYRLVLVLLVR